MVTVPNPTNLAHNFPANFFEVSFHMSALTTSVLQTVRFLQLLLPKLYMHFSSPPPHVSHMHRHSLLPWFDHPKFRNIWWSQVLSTMLSWMPHVTWNYLMTAPCFEFLLHVGSLNLGSFFTRKPPWLPFFNQWTKCLNRSIGDLFHFLFFSSYMDILIRDLLTRRL